MFTSGNKVISEL